MAGFVKLDCGLLNSTLWSDRDARDIFITALLLAEPDQITLTTAQLEVRTLKETGWCIPPGWYGMVHAAGTGICRHCGIDDGLGLAALERLGSPDLESRTPDFEGRRLVRIDGGYLILNFFKYRDRDYTAAKRMQAFRERKKSTPLRVTSRNMGVTSRNVTQAEAEAEAYKNSLSPANAVSISSLKKRELLEALLAKYGCCTQMNGKDLLPEWYNAVQEYPMEWVVAVFDELRQRPELPSKLRKTLRSLNTEYLNWRASADEVVP